MPRRFPSACLATLLFLSALGCGGGTNSPPGQGKTDATQTLDTETGSGSLSAPPPEAAKP